MRIILADQKGVVTIDSLNFSFLYDEKLHKDSGGVLKLHKDVPQQQAKIESMCNDLAKVLISHRT